MIRKAIDTLSTKLSDGLSLSNSRLETLCLLVIGIASVRTVNLSHISGEMPTQAKVGPSSACSRKQNHGLQPGGHPALDHEKGELASRSRCLGHGMGGEDGIPKTWHPKAPRKITRQVRQVHLPHRPRRNQKALANPSSTSLPALAQNQTENSMSRVQGAWIHFWVTVGGRFLRAGFSHRRDIPAAATPGLPIQIHR